MKAFFLLCILCLFTAVSNAQTVWNTSFDGEIQFYQTTDFGILLTGTDNSLYAVDGETGQRLWRRSHRGLDETSITPIPGTDLVLLSLDEGKRSQLEAIDLLSGNSIWQSDKVKGDVMQLAVEPESDLLAVVLVIKGFSEIGKELKREPVVHVLNLSSGVELWKHQLKSDVEMMPARFGENLGKVPHTLDNYRAPLILDGRLFLFYEGATSYDARTGEEREREEFTINEDALALTDADPVFDENNIYISGRGKVRAIERKTGKVIWKADDLGVTPEMAILGNTLYVRTGGQFTSIRDGEIKKHGPFGVSAIDTRTGERIWRYKGADKGITNFVFSDVNTIFIADKDDLIAIDAKSGKRLNKVDHNVDKAQFILINERGEAVIGGRDTLSAFQISAIRSQKEKVHPVWTAKHKPPSRGIIRVAAGIALRATALYFRYGGLATSALNAFRGANLAKNILSYRWSGLKMRFSSLDLTTIASNAATNYVAPEIRIYGLARQNPHFLERLLDAGMQRELPNIIRGKIIRSITPLRSDVQEGLLERLDPIRQVEKLSDYLLHHKRLTEFRGNYMYFYTDLPEPFDKKGLVGVNIHNGQDARFIPIPEPDTRFITDETLGLLYSADGRRLQAFDVLTK